MAKKKRNIKKRHKTVPYFSLSGQSTRSAKQKAHRAQLKKQTQRFRSYGAAKTKRSRSRRTHGNPSSATQWIKAKAVRVRKVAGRTILDILK